MHADLPIKKVLSSYFLIKFSKWKYQKKKKLDIYENRLGIYL